MVESLKSRKQKRAYIEQDWVKIIFVIEDSELMTKTRL